MTLSTTHLGETYSSPIQYPDFFSKGPALCTQVDSELFFPTGNEIRSEMTKQVMKICDDCPYKVECLEWALVNREDGIWGGTDEQMRAAMSRGGKSRTGRGK